MAVTAKAPAMPASSSEAPSQHTSAYVSIRQHTSASSSEALSQHTSEYVSIRQHPSASYSEALSSEGGGMSRSRGGGALRRSRSEGGGANEWRISRGVVSWIYWIYSCPQANQTLSSVSEKDVTGSLMLSLIRQHTSAYVSIRGSDRESDALAHTSAYVSIRLAPRCSPSSFSSSLPPPLRLSFLSSLSFAASFAASGAFSAALHLRCSSSRSSVILRAPALFSSAASHLLT